MEVRNSLSSSLLVRWHTLHFFDSLLFHGQPNSLTRDLWTHLESRLEKAGQRYGAGKVVELPRVEGMSPQEFYTNHLGPNRPVVLAGAAKDWRCVHEWSPDYFAQQYGNASIVTVEGKHWKLRDPAVEKVSDQMYKDSFALQDYKVADLIDDIRKGGSRYASFYPFFTYHPELMQHFDLGFLERYFHLNKTFPWQRKIFPKLFMGGAGTSTPTHCAGIINLFVQIYGEKQWDLWSPLAAPFLYAERRVANNVASIVDFRNPNDQEFPLFKYADRYRTVLRPGDILFVPSWWWHAVQNLTATISASNFVLRMRSTPGGYSFNWRALLDPWTIAVFCLGNDDAGKEWEIRLPRFIYTARTTYWGNWAGFAHFVVMNAAKKLRFQSGRQSHETIVP